MVHYDFIEIGTSDFDTMIEKATDTDRGISVEPVKQYLDNLPCRKNCIKVQAAISNKNGIATIWYLSEQINKQYKMVQWSRGCNRLGEPHPMIKSYFDSIGVNCLDVYTRKDVRSITLIDLMKRYNVTGFTTLKIDTEGHDTVILNHFANNATDKQLPTNIIFETNNNSTLQDVEHCLSLLQQRGYRIVSRGMDTVLVRSNSTQKSH